MAAKKGRKPSTNPSVILPNSNGRSTESSYSWYQFFYDKYSYLPEIVPINLYTMLEELSIYDETISKVRVDFINTTLSGIDIKCENTKFKEELLDFLNNGINKNNGGLNGLIRRWAGQAFIYDAICGEIVINSEMDGIEDVVLFDPKTIRFKLKNKDYKLCQQSYTTAEIKELPDLTCFYLPTSLENDIPYAIPRLASVIPATKFKNIVEKGTLNQVEHWGFNTVVGKLNTNKFRKVGDETDEEYDKRVLKSLNQLQDTISNKKGGQPILTTDAIELNVVEGVENAQDIASINSMAYSKLANALKVDKMMLNQGDFNTDVYNTVPYKNFLKQVEQAQRVILIAIRKIIDLYMLLKGVSEIVDVEFIENEVNDEFKAAQADQMRTRATVLRYQNGFIDSNQAAQECGYDKAALDLKPWELDADNRALNGTAGGDNGNG